MMEKQTTIVCQKELKKASPSEKREILHAFDKLCNMIQIEESYGNAFEKIYNNDTLKYDILGNGFHTFKCQGRDRSQIRLLYRFVRKENKEFEIQLHKAYMKRRNTKEYMKIFEEYVKKYV